MLTELLSELPSKAGAPFDPVRLQDRSPVGDTDRFPPGRHPYYITAPRYIRTSAGIKALHMLCHALNRAGYEAYMAIFPVWLGADRVSPDLLTPVLTPAIARRHRRAGLAPIVVYPETVGGNPWRARTIVRYVLNFPGLLGGDHSYPPDEMVYGYSAVLAEACNQPGKVLFVPASDATVFTPAEQDTPRQGACFYAMKYQVVHQGPLLPETEGAIEITRDRPDSQSPAEIAEILRRSEVFYAYENTALALEAALCLCPTVFLPNPWLTEVIAVKEMGWDGFAWGTAPEEVARARATVHLARNRYLATYHQFWEQLGVFARETQARAEADARAGRLPRGMAWWLLCLPQWERVRTLARLTRASLLRNGPAATGRLILDWFRRRLPGFHRLRFLALLGRVTLASLRERGLRATGARALRFLSGRLPGGRLPPPARG
ncbi:hypothetical protein NON00_06805 [Roseomonas sp. GC11]|uniref:hypothetical protein n=1 Tax=Roseomonas sp. GC11 TaxID=2950546 RepID=UPI00210BE80B|nr:hypothetical protein [Roseomonas sp. GC11]MCQ4159632.1 hypothetical protein [Roseomonas sp. GC11]